MARARTRAPSLWVITRYAPSSSRWSERVEFYVRQSERPSGIPLQGFSDEKAAEAERDRLEREARLSMPIGPFLREFVPGGITHITDAAKVAGVPLPDFSKLGPAAGPTTLPGGGRSYGQEYFDYSDRVHQAVEAWWASVVANITPEANATLWDELFPEFAFYTLSRVLLEE
ncbi:MAG: hypothetical protein L0241_27845 [Planctomycetia bacterium]|nr:hypothetical protein [Planctomycetia bacterium]